MNALKIRVQTTSASTAATTFWVDYEAPEGRSLRALIDKHGNLRIIQVQTHQDVDIETKQQLETIHTVEVWNHNDWRRYCDGNTDTSIQG